MIPQSIDSFYNPERFLNDLIQKYAQGLIIERGENAQLFFRATVMAVDVVGGKLENPDGDGSVEHRIGGRSVTFPARRGPKNPKNSVKARIISEGFDQFMSDEDVRIYWPLFPEHIAVPVSPGEHVYVMFEDKDFKHGLWLTRVPGHENTNYFKGESSFSAGDSDISSLFGDPAVSGPPAQMSTDVAASEVQSGDRSAANAHGDQ